MIIRPVIRLFALWIFLVALCFVPGSARAQTGSITGRVKDSTGALVPEVRISARNTATNASRTAQTDDSGTYRIASLVPGIYDVLIEKDGFKTVEFLHVALTVDLVQNLDATLVPSSLTARVTVTGESVAPIDLNDAQVGNMVTSEQIMGLPLVLRDPYVQFNQPDNNFTLASQTFCQPTGEVGRPDGTSGARQIQFGLRLRF